MIQRLLTTGFRNVAAWLDFLGRGEDPLRSPFFGLMPIPAHSGGGLDLPLGSTRTLTDRTEAETELSRLNRHHALLSRCARSLAMAADEADLLDAFCRNLVDVGGYPYAWVGYATYAPTLRICTKAQAGQKSERARHPAVVGAAAQAHPKLCRTAILTGRPVIVPSWKSADGRQSRYLLDATGTRLDRLARAHL